MNGDIQLGAGGAPLGRSSVERLPPPVREAVDAAIAEGASIDGITTLIRERGGDCSRSAVGRYAKRRRQEMQRLYEARRIAEAWAREAAEGPEDRTDVVLIEAVRSLALIAVAGLSGREEPATMEELGRVALALRRLEGCETLRMEKESAVAKAAGRGGGAEPQRGLSPDTIIAIRRVVEGTG